MSIPDDSPRAHPLHASRRPSELLRGATARWGLFFFTAIVVLEVSPLRAESDSTGWVRPSVHSTLNDGLELYNLAYNIHPVIDRVSVPFFLFNDVRYELTETGRISGPLEASADGMVQYLARYVVKLPDGDLRVDMYYTLLEAGLGTGRDDHVASSEAQFSCWIQFEGPRGDYTFFWRIDPDLGGRSTNRADIVGDLSSVDDAGVPAWGEQGGASSDMARATGPARWVPVTEEGSIDPITFPVRVVDTRSYHESFQLRLAALPQDNPLLHVRLFHSGELESAPAQSMSRALLDRLPGRIEGEKPEHAGVVPAHGGVAPAHTGVAPAHTWEVLEGDGADLVLWYEVRLHDTRGALIGPDFLLTQPVRSNAVVEQDKMVSAGFVATRAESYGKSLTFEEPYASACINVTDVIDDQPDIPDDESTTDAELHSIMLANKTYEYLDSSTQWYSYVLVANYSSRGDIYGTMFDDSSMNTDGKPRQGCAVFYGAHIYDWPEEDSMEAELLLTFTHETGHVYNQHHEDYCAPGLPGSTLYRNSSIMGYAYLDTLRWTFSPGSIRSMCNDPEEYVRPGHGLPFTDKGAYSMTSEHASAHARLSCRVGCCR